VGTILANNDQIEIPLLLWRRLLQQLASRGRGRRESGAFLLGRQNVPKRQVVDFICYDDLDPRALSHGIVEFHRAGFSSLWATCNKRGLHVLADVHTHPTLDVRQSTVDKAHPMIPIAGHVALIVPSFGDTSVWSLSRIGIHRFLGKRRWQSFAAGDTDTPVRLSLW
jgi:proteasome lid subunit RPN8/RPN11